MCDPVSATIAVLGAGASAVSYSQQRRAQRANEAAMREQAAAMAKTQRDAQEAEARASRPVANLSQIMSSNRAGGMASTLLTGAGGAPLSQMALGRNTLLGQ